MKTLILVLVACLALTGSSRLIIPQDYEEFSAMSQKYQFNFQQFLDMFLRYSSGVLTGLTEIIGEKNASKCFENIQNVTDVIQELINYKWSGSFWPTTREALVICVKILNITIEEWDYCYNIYDIGYRFWGILRYIWYDSYRFFRDVGYNLLHYSFWYIYDIKNAYKSIQAKQDANTGASIAKVAFRVLLNYTYYHHTVSK
jgi:hypothetical protein